MTPKHHHHHVPSLFLLPHSRSKRPNSLSLSLLGSISLLNLIIRVHQEGAKKKEEEELLGDNELESFERERVKGVEGSLLV